MVLVDGGQWHTASLANNFMYPDSLLAGGTMPGVSDGKKEKL
jgi:hypothetical protein